MAETSTIEWTDSTWNPITGCSLVSEGCRHCYAARLAATRMKSHPSRAGLARLNRAGEAKFTGEVRFNADWLDQPLRWRRPRRIFVCAHSDLFHENVPDEWIDRVFAVMALAPQHTFQVLTKRPERARDYLTALAEPRREVEIREAVRKSGARLLDLSDLSRRITALPLPNVWLGTSAEDQATADERIPHLLETPVAVRFLSAEPLLGPVSIAPWLHDSDCYLFRGMRGRENVCTCSEPREDRLDWVIVGGESGAHARPMHPDWARSLRDQCQDAGVPFFFKQWGEYRPEPAHVTYAVAADKADRRGIDYVLWESGDSSLRYGKARAGRLLDGREWSQMPRQSPAQERLL